ncbi:MAG: hypothetical protein SNJ59_12275 [Aggregatilineales bacterium]
MSQQIVRCPSCDGYGWVEDEKTGATDCDWCVGIGYIYRDQHGVDRPIPASDFATIAEELERLEAQRLRELGYTGQAKKPWEQSIRRSRR